MKRTPNWIQNFLPAALIVGGIVGLWCVVKAFKERAVR